MNCFEPATSYAINPTMQIEKYISFFVIAVLGLPAFSEEAIDFNRDIRPILADHCFPCHGNDEGERQADLRLDTPSGATADLGGYQALVPNDLESSEAWARIVATDDSQMPPADYEKQLPDEDRSKLKLWIEQGIPYAEHWSFVAPLKPAPPKIPDIENPIDAFIQSRLAQVGLQPSPIASRETLIRRLSLDLTGLPPTIQEVEAFKNDDSPNAYQQLIDRLQGSQTYGEHMARYWLDLARYADTHGLHLDNERSMWPYRDWVIRAFNNNLPFDDFTRWQLAGDLLPSPSRDQLIASGFNRCNVSTSEGGSINKEWIFRYAVDRTSTMSEVWMGLTAGCAVCHDHKFDPLTTREYYSMYAFFHSAADPAMDGNISETPPILRLTAEKDEEEIAQLRKELKHLEEQIVSTLRNYNYEDPALVNPPVVELKTNEIWFDDGFPAGANLIASGNPLEFRDSEKGPVKYGSKSLFRKAGKVVAQDSFTKGANIVVPSNAKFFVHCYIEPDDLPETIMVQFHTKGWNHRAVWGAAEKIPFGRPNTTEKANMGDLPKAGEWVKLEFDAKQVGLKPGETITGYAFTQFGGSVNWDYCGVEATVNPSKDPRHSWKAWKARDFGILRKDLTDALKREFQGRTPDTWTEQEEQRIYEYWLRNFSVEGKAAIASLANQFGPIESKIASIEKAAPATMVMANLPQPRESFVMIRGAYDRPGEKVVPAVPSFLPGLSPDGQTDRLALANWLLDRKHPLTARVTVNRIWQQFFGVGLVETSEDFGTQGALPSHPELLDWLAVQFMDDGWDLKKLVQRIVTSHTYRQHSKRTERMLKIDPSNRLLASAPRLRLDAEVLRDQALYVSGLLVPDIGGPGVKPYQPPNIWEPVGFGNSNTRYYKQDSGSDLYRRSIYTFIKRTAPPPFMSSFDAPNREQSCSRRQRSNTPMQALQLLNDIQHVEAAKNLAVRILSEGGKDEQERASWAWQTLTGRSPSDVELRISLRQIETNKEKYKAEPESALSLLDVGESKLKSGHPVEELAAYTLLANLLLNLDETVSKN